MILSEAVSVQQMLEPVPADVKRSLKLFQSVLSIVLEHYHAQYANDRRGQLQSVSQFKELKQKMAQHKNVPFVKPIIDQLDQINKEFIEKHKTAKTLKSVDVRGPLDSILKAWQSNDANAIIQAAPPLVSYLQSKEVATKDPLAGKRNPLYIENPLFFMSSNFLESFELEQIKEAATKDLSQFQYSYLPLPPDKRDNFQYLGYYILALKDNDRPVTLTGKQIQKYLDLAYSGSEYQSLVQLVQEYLLDNNIDNIPKILELIKSFPEIEKLNNSAKQSVTTVYRGVSGEPSLTQILQQERENRFVATSDMRSVAENFALQRGHLEGKDTRRVDHAVILTYSVTPDSILLDTTIFGGVFGEGEILIDTALAVFEGAEFL